MRRVLFSVLAVFSVASIADARAINACVDEDGDDYEACVRDPSCFWCQDGEPCPVCACAGCLPGDPGWDCDDTRPLINPAATELCATRVDENCDGRFDEMPCGFPESCENGVDDDLDGLVDGADPDCVGATFVVNSTSDDAVPSPNPCFTGGVCTLRAAIVAANSDLAADTIVVPDGTYELGMAGRNEDAGLTGDLDVTGPVVIEGAGAGATVIDARGIDRVLSVLGPGDPAARCQAYCAQFPDRCDECLPDTLMRATLRGLTIRGGQAQGPGGGILSNNSRLRLEDARVEDCATEPSPFGYFHSGGGIDSTGELILVRSEIVRNRVGSPGEPSSAQNVGGGIHHSGFVGYTRFAGLTALEIRESVIAENYAPRGGGVAAFGSLPLRIVDSAIRGNRAADSGGIYAETYAIEIERSTIARNVADSVAGMYAWIFSDTSLPQDPAIPDVGRLNLRASSIVENASETGAGGLVILCDGSICEAAIENATISSNTVANPPAGFIGAGGLYLRAASGEVGPSTLSATLSHVTIAANAEGPNLPSVALLGDAFGFLDVTWSGAIADGACHLDPEVENASLGGNVERDATCGFVAPGDHRNADARLGPLGDNGGPTPTHLPGAGSPALGAVPAAQCPPTDQRGEPRPQGSAPACDAGAAEVDEEAPGCAPMGHGSASPLALAPFALAFAVLRRTRRRSP